MTWQWVEGSEGSRQSARPGLGLRGVNSNVTFMFNIFPRPWPLCLSSAAQTSTLPVNRWIDKHHVLVLYLLGTIQSRLRIQKVLLNLILSCCHCWKLIPDLSPWISGRVVIYWFGCPLYIKCMIDYHLSLFDFLLSITWLINILSPMMTWLSSINCTIDKHFVNAPYDNYWFTWLVLTYPRVIQVSLLGPQYMYLEALNGEKAMHLSLSSTSFHRLIIVAQRSRH